MFRKKKYINLILKLIFFISNFGRILKLNIKIYKIKIENKLLNVFNLKILKIKIINYKLKSLEKKLKGEKK